MGFEPTLAQANRLMGEHSTNWATTSPLQEWQGWYHMCTFMFSHWKSWLGIFLACITLIIDSRGLQYTVNLWRETIGCKSFCGDRFHLGQLLLGQTMMAQYKSAHITSPFLQTSNCSNQHKAAPILCVNSSIGLQCIASLLEVKGCRSYVNNISMFLPLSGTLCGVDTFMHLATQVNIVYFK